MLARIDSCAVLGIDAHLVQTQVDVASGMAYFTVVGLPDPAVQESRERVRSAIRNSNFSFPGHRVTVNLEPADIRKEGPAFDLPIALAVLAATEQVASEDMERLVAVGELSLDGSVRPISGVLPIALAARAHGCAGLIVPADNVAEGGMHLTSPVGYGLAVGQRYEILLGREEEDGRQSTLWGEGHYVTVVRTRFLIGESDRVGVGLRFDQPLVL